MHAYTHFREMINLLCKKGGQYRKVEYWCYKTTLNIVGGCRYICDSLIIRDIRIQSQLFLLVTFILYAKLILYLKKTICFKTKF